MLRSNPKRPRGNCLAIYMAIIVLMGLVPWRAHAEQLSFVLTGNAGPREAGLELDCSYSADPPYTNPADEHNRRLIDGDPVRNWHTTTGINYQDQNVTFDLKAICRIDAVALLFDASQKPAYVQVSVADSPEGPWRSVGKLSKADQKDPWWRLDVPGTHARYVKFFHKLDNWGWYLREVKVYGNVAQGSVRPALQTSAGDPILIFEGQACATIVVADAPAPHALKAATVLQGHLRRMTGVMLPIETQNKFAGSSTPILVGMSNLARKHGLEVKQDAGNDDHYVIRTDKAYIAVVGNDVGRRRGSIYAAYDLLERLGCGWFGPAPLWQVMPKSKTLSVPRIDVDERAAFDMRNIWMVKDATMRDVWRLTQLYASCGHALGYVLPRDEYLQAHPEYFGQSQPCLSHPDVFEIVAERFRAQIDRQEGVVWFSLSPEDTGGFCQRARCAAVGNVSAQLLNFANEIARRLAQTHPGRYRLCFLAYWYTHDPPSPAIQAEPGIVVMQVNEGDHVQPWDEPESANFARSTGRNNTRELNAFTGWQQSGATMAIYEWWIPGCNDINWRSVPWYSGDTALRNLRYWQQANVRYITYETQFENGDGFPIRWPLYYVGARGMWDPNTTSEQIMTQACAKLYGPAADHMLRFYQVIESAMADSNAHGGNWHLPSPQMVYSQALETRATQHLDAAAAAASTMPSAAARIAQERKMWDQAKQVMAKLRGTTKPVFAVHVNGKAMDWKQANISIATIRSLHGIEPSTPIFAVEQDGQKRRAKEDEVFGLTTGIKFVTQP
jgi:hypothetical protein